MGNGTFFANTTNLSTNSSNIEQNAIDFNNCVQNIYEKIQEMISSDYVSSEATAIANEIETYREDLKRLGIMIDKYSRFLNFASNKIEQNKEHVISSIK